MTIDIRATLQQFLPVECANRSLVISRAYADGRTYEDIATEHGVSRERIRQIVHRTAARFVPKVPAVRYDSPGVIAALEYHTKYMKIARGYRPLPATREQKATAYRVYGAARAKGEIVRPDTCTICGVKPEPRLMQGHHVDYSKPLDVVWVCSSCHALIHHRQALAEVA